MSIYAIFGGLLVVANLYAIARILRSDASTERMALWIAIVLLLPIAGLVGWLFFGPT